MRAQGLLNSRAGGNHRFYGFIVSEQGKCKKGGCSAFADQVINDVAPAYMRGGRHSRFPIAEAPVPGSFRKLRPGINQFLKPLQVKMGHAYHFGCNVRCKRSGAQQLRTVVLLPSGKWRSG